MCAPCVCVCVPHTHLLKRVILIKLSRQAFDQAAAAINSQNKRTAGSAGNPNATFNCVNSGSASASHAHSPSPCPTQLACHDAAATKMLNSRQAAQLMAKAMHKSGQNVLQAKGQTGGGLERERGGERGTMLQLTLPLLLKITKIMLNR